MFRAAAVRLRAANVNNFTVFIKQIYKTNKFPALKAKIQAMPVTQRGKTIGQAYRKLDKAQMAALSQAAKQIKPVRVLSRKAKWMKKAANQKQFKGLKGAAKLKAMAKKWKKLNA